MIIFGEGIDGVRADVVCAVHSLTVVLEKRGFQNTRFIDTIHYFNSVLVSRRHTLVQIYVAEERNCGIKYFKSYKGFPDNRILTMFTSTKPSLARSWPRPTRGPQPTASQKRSLKHYNCNFSILVVPSFLS